MSLSPRARLAFIAARAALILVVHALLAFGVTRDLAGFLAGFARVPRDGPLPFHLVTDGLGALDGAFVATLALALTLLVLAGPTLQAALLAHVTARGADDGRGRLARALDDGLSHLGRFLRAGVLFAPVVALAVGAVVLATRPLSIALERGFATGLEQEILLPIARMLLVALGGGVTGAWALHTRALIVADGRRRVARAAVEAVRIVLRAPLASFGRFIALSALVDAVGLATLIVPGVPEPGALTLPLFLVYVVMEAWVWQALTESAATLVVERRFDDVRGRGDMPLAPFAAARDLLLRLLGR